MSFNKVLEKYRTLAFSERDKGDRFERLIQTYLQTDPRYAYTFKHVWMWNEFPGKKDFGGKDTGIDLVAMTFDGDYWAVQCKCYSADASIDKKSVDSFLSTSSREFKNEQLQTIGFSNRLWVSTTNKWGSNAEETIRNQNPPVTRINLHDLESAPVDWEKLDKGITGDLARTTKKELRPHQEEALKLTEGHLKDHDRGKLIMACGTGKTFTSLRIAENETKGDGLVLFLVPSIALLGQTLREWTADAKEPIHPICICSDSKITKQQANLDAGDTSPVDLAFPASTNVKSIVKQFQALRATDKKGLKVVFSTYQSIDVIAEAQKQLLKEKNSLGEFDLIICDEAHRTTGVTLSDSDESSFVKVHNNDFIKAKKRLYMTATPRLFSDDSKSKAAQSDAEICSMDDPSKYGEEIYRIGFGEAVERDLLTDYKVLVLTLSDKDIPPAVQKMIANDSQEINSDDASKLIGCINALSKQVLGDEGLLKSSDPDPMQRAVAFCQNIKISNKITNVFNSTSDVYLDSIEPKQREKLVSVASKHIDGSMTAPQRDELLGWLKSTAADPNECRILTNVRCLSEGVDVPSLDSVLFLSARNSQVDVVQSVGRVMRKAPGKKYGYIIIPVVVPSDVSPEEALNDNERFKVVWSVLNALRAHDDRFNATINKIDLNKKKPSQIMVGGVSHGRDDEDVTTSQAARDINNQLALQFEELQSVVYAKMVQKVGDRVYWEKWANDVAIIAQNQISRINNLIETNTKHRKEFEKFLTGLQKNINPSITKEQSVEMLSQHIITKPVFEALFEGYSFVKSNPISSSMQAMLDLLEDEGVEKDTETLDKFYDSVKKRAAGIDNAEGKQRIIIELYDKFFKNAFPKMVEQLGIVYTPVEVVDFIIHSVNDVLKQEFGRSITDENIHILDPFTGTGTFITRLLQSGLIEQKDLERKYLHELHANEIVLLAYYIANVNIENAYHDATEDPNDGIGKDIYVPFEGMCLTDTFQLGEIEDSVLFSEMFPKNSERLEQQKKGPIRVIMGNPPYSVGQKSANDNAQNLNYPKLEGRISESYAKKSTATSKISLYDSYVKAFRWASDRISEEDGGVIAFITNSGWIDKGASDGIRRTFEKEFSAIHILNLKGAIRGKSGEAAKREGQNIFDILTGVAITILVKTPNSGSDCKIKYSEVKDYSPKIEKLNFLREKISILNPSLRTKGLTPNKHGDWLNQRSDGFGTLIPICVKVNTRELRFFDFVSNGAKSQRDAWCYNYSKSNLRENISNSISFYNEQRLNLKSGKQNDVIYDSTKFSWTVNTIRDAKKNIEFGYDNKHIRQVCYRPFNKQNWYSDKNLNERISQSFKLFPSDEYENVVLFVSGLNTRLDRTSVFISNSIVDLNCLDSGTQCFPLYYYEKRELVQGNLFDSKLDSEFIKRDGVSNEIFERAKKQYGKSISKEDIFYYVYGILHSEDYRQEFSNDLKKLLPRMPLLESPKDFWEFSKAGRALAEIHINYESVPAYEGVSVKGADSNFFKVEKMRFPKKDQRDSIIYNSKITISNIPDEAYEYVVNGKSAIEWIMERYRVTVDLNSKGEGSGIKNDPNDWAEEVGNPRYILDLLLSIINVSVQTVEIVKGLPKLDFNEGGSEVKLYPNLEDSESFNVAAEPGNKE